MCTGDTNEIKHWLLDKTEGLRLSRLRLSVKRVESGGPCVETYLPLQKAITNALHVRRITFSLLKSERKATTKESEYEKVQQSETKNAS